jgi:hypothetical protein
MDLACTARESYNMPTKLFSGNAKRHGLLDGVGIGGNITLKLTLKKEIPSLWIGIMGTSVRLLRME